MQITPCGGRKVKIPVLSLTVHFPGYLVTSIEKKIRLFIQFSA